jgi:GrpB-like predicted nucleotidyltransferase (UPF0157 family)
VPSTRNGRSSRSASLRHPWVAPRHSHRYLPHDRTSYLRVDSRVRGAPRRRPRPPEANTVVPYADSWPQQFEAIRRHLAPALAELPVTIEHVGSTSVPGLAAKPIIDVDIVVHDEADVDAVIERLEPIGYMDWGDLGVEGRQALFETGGPFTLAYHHLYVVVEGTRAHLDHVLFRDYLRGHPAAAVAYAARKLDVAHLITVASREGYLEAKSGIVEEILGRARAERPWNRPTAI